MEIISIKLTDMILKKGIINSEDYAIYKYGLQTGLEMLVCVILCVIISSILNIVIQSFIVAIVLFSLRAYICGIHMKKYISCLFCSTIVLTVGSYVVSFITLSKYILLLLGSVMLISIDRLSYSTIAYNAEAKEIKFLTKQRKRIILGIQLSLIILFVLNNTKFATQVCYAILIALLSVVVEVIRIKLISKIQEIKGEEDI